MRLLPCIAILLCTAGCGCVLEEGDGVGVKEYWKGCMDAAQGN